jgi:alpha,alpha-trehalose phosphorylase
MPWACLDRAYALAVAGLKDPGWASADPAGDRLVGRDKEVARVAAQLDHPLVSEQKEMYENAVVLVHRTIRSGLRIGVAMDHMVEGPQGVRAETRIFEDGGEVAVTSAVRPGERLRVIKFVAYGWSEARSLSAIRSQVWAALSAARQTGWEGLPAEQRAFLTSSGRG